MSQQIRIIPTRDFLNLVRALNQSGDITPAQRSHLIQELEKTRKSGDATELNLYLHELLRTTSSAPTIKKLIAMTE